MSTLSHKIDFAVIFTVKDANPNGDPLNSGRPREDIDGFGEITDVCLKRKIRNRLQDMGEKIFIQTDERCDDGFESLKERADSNRRLKGILAEKNVRRADYIKAACEEWTDVRAFGQVFAFRGSPVSIGIRGPVSIGIAKSVSPIDITATRITRSVNGECCPSGKASDTMAVKHRVDFGLYIARGSISHQLAEKTGFTDEDAEKIKKALLTLFENDSSSARPDGSMEVCGLCWWKHLGDARYTSAAVHRTLHISCKSDTAKPCSIDDYVITTDTLDGLGAEIYGIGGQIKPKSSINIDIQSK